jgi:uncharacterized paraquat-inducible protein A
MIFFSEEEKRRFSDITNNSIKCSCGHSILTNKKKALCNWCGKYVYKDKKLEFQEKLKASLKGGNNENI